MAGSIVLSAAAFAQANFLSFATGNWSSATTWTIVSGSDADGIPDANDNVQIQFGHTVTLIGAQACTNVAIDAGGALNTNGNTLTASGSFALNGTWSGTGTITLTGAATTIDGTGSATGASTLSLTTAAKTIQATANLTFANISIAGAITVTNNGTVTATGNITGSVAGSTWLNAANSTLNIAGSLLTTGTLTATANPNTVNYSGTATVDQTVKGTTYHHLNVTRGASNAALITAATTLNGNLTVASGTLDVRGVNLTVNGTTSVSGTLTFTTSVAGAKIFVALVTINGGGSWTNPINEGFTFRGGLTNNGTFNSGTGTYTFDTNSQAFNASTGITFSGPVAITGVITVTNNTSVAIAGALTGSVAGSTWQNAASSSLDLGAATLVTGTLDASASPNTVRYVSTTAAQTVKAATYHHLGIVKSAQTATINGATTINGDLTLTSGTLVVSGATTVGANATVTSGTLNLRGVDFTVNGVTSIGGTLSFTTSNLGIKTFVGAVTINSGGAWTNSINESVTLNGGLTHNGTTFTSGTGTYTFDTNPQNIGGTSAISIANLAVNGVTLTNTGTLTLTTSLSGSGGITNGTNAALSINFTGALGIAVITASATGNSVSYGAAGAQTIANPTGSTHYHLTIAGSGAKTASASLTIDGNLAVNAGTLNDAGFQITGNATRTMTMAAGTGLILGSPATATSFPTNFIASKISLSSTSTVIYNSDQSQTVSGTPTYGNLTLAATAAVTKTAGAALLVTNALTIGINNMLADGGFTMTVNGNTSNSGSHTGTGKIRLSGGSAAHTISGTGSYGNVELDDVQGASIGASTTISGDLTITNGTLTIGAFSINVSGTTSISGTVNITSATGLKTFGNLVINTGGAFNNSVNESITVNGNIQNDGTFTAGTGVYTLAGTGQTLSGANGLNMPSATINGTYANNTNLTISTALAGTGTLTNGANSILEIRGTATLTTLDASASPNTVIYNSTSANQTFIGATYHHLTVDKGTMTGIITANTIVNGNLRIISGTLSVRGADLTVNGPTSVDGTLTFATSNVGTKTFVGPVTMNATGSWTNPINESFTFNSGLTHNGTTFTAGTGTYTFDTSSQNIGGSGAISIANVTVNGVTLTNTGALTVTSSLTGTGAMTNGTNANLNLNFIGAVGVTTLTAAAAGNTVNYGAAGAQTIADPTSSTYHHLTVSGSGTKSLSAPITVNGDLTISGSVVLVDGGFQITGNATGGMTMGAGTGLTLGTAASATSYPTNYVGANITLNVTSTVTYNSNLTQTISSVPTYGNLTLVATAAVTKTLDGALTINGNLTIGVNNTLDVSASNFAIDLAGNWSAAAGSVFTAGAGTVTFNGSGAQSITGTLATKTFNDVVINKGVGTLLNTAGGTTTVSVNNLTMTQGNFTPPATLNITGTLTLTAGTLTAGTNINVGGDWTNNGGTFTPGAGTVTFNSTTAGQSINWSAVTQTFNNITVNKTGQTLSVGGSTTTLVLNSNLTLSAGIFFAGTATTIDISGNWTNNGGTFNPGTGTVTFSSGTAQAINGTALTQTFNNVTVSKSGNTLSVGGSTTTLALNGAMTLASGTFSAGTATTISIVGNWTNNGGTFTPGASTVSFNGTSGSQAINGTALAHSFNGLTLNNSNGLTLAANVTVNGALTFTSGNITTAANRIAISSTGSVVRTSGHVVGNLEKNVATGATARTFEIGDASNYTPVQISFASVTIAGSLTANTTTGDHPDIVNSSIDETQSVNRYWTVTNSGVAFTTYDATFTFVPADVDGGADPNEFIVGKLDGTTWSQPTVGTRTATSAQATGMSSFSEFVVGLSNTKTWDGGAGTNNWGDAANWNPNGVPRSSTDVLLTGANTINVNVAALGKNVTLSNSSLTLTILAGNSLSASSNLMLTSGTLNTEAAFPTVSGTITIAGGTVGYTGAGNQAVVLLSYNNLTFANAGTKTFAAGTTQISGNFAVAGAAAADATTNNTTIEFSSGAAQDFAGITYYNLTMSGAGTKSASGNVAVNNNFSNASTTSLGTFTLLIGGTKTNSGTIQFAGASNGVPFSGGTVEYNGTSAQTITAGTYGTLVLSNTGLKTVSSAVNVSAYMLVSAGSSLTVDATGVLSITGDFDNDGVLTNNGTITVQ